MKLCQSGQHQVRQFNFLVFFRNKAKFRNIFHFLCNLFKVGTLYNCLRGSVHGIELDVLLNALNVRVKVYAFSEHSIF